MCNEIFIICKTVYNCKKRCKIKIINFIYLLHIICEYVWCQSEILFCPFPRSWGCGDGLFKIRDRGQETVTSRHAESLQLNTTQHCWLMERAEPETREGRGSAACQLPHFPSLPHSPLLPHTNCYTIGPCGRTTWWLIANESERVLAGKNSIWVFKFRFCIILPYNGVLYLFPWET